MTRNVIFGFLSALAGVSLVSGQDLGAVELERRLYGYEPEPASWCFTYYSCYLAPLETPQYPLPGGVVTTITSIVQITTSLPGLPSPSPPSSPTPSPSPLPGPLDIILAIIPTVSGRSLEKRTLEKKDLGGFISEVGIPNPKDCRAATVYRLDSARLQLSARLSASIFADAGTSFTEFRTRESLNAGANVVATTFLDDNSVLRWLNASFSGGEAGFCQVPATGQVYATYVASPTQWPAGCLPIRLSVLRRDQCPDGSTTPSPLPSTTSISTTQSLGPPSPSSLPQTTPGLDSSTTIASSAVPTSPGPVPTPSSSVPESSSLDSTTQSTFSPVPEPTSGESSPTPESTTSPIIPPSSSEPPPPETSSTSESNPVPPDTSSTRTPSTSLSSSSLSTGSTQSTPSTRSTQSASTGSTSQTAPTRSTSQTPSTGSTSQTPSTGSTSRTASTGSTSQTAPTGSTSQTAPTASTSQTAPTASTSQTAPTASTSQTAPTASTSQTAPTASTSQTASTEGTSQTASTESTLSTTSTQSIPSGASSTIFPSSTGFANSSTSGPPNLCSNGGFENGPVYFPWYLISSTPGVSNSGIVPSISTPDFANHPDGGQYALKLGFVDNTVANTVDTLDFGQSVQTVLGHSYTISFDAVGCGSPGDTVVVTVGVQTINTLDLARVNCNIWATYEGSFVGSGLDAIKVSILSKAAAGLNQFYFDNFVVTDVTT